MSFVTRILLKMLFVSLLTFYFFQRGADVNEYMIKSNTSELQE